MVAVKEQIKRCHKTFTVQNVSTDKLASIIKKLKTKASKSDDIRTKIIKELGIFFAEFLSKNFNSCLEACSLSESLKCAEFVPMYKKNDEKIKVTIDLYVFCPTFQKYMKDACKNNLTNISVIYYQNISVVSDKVMGLRTVSWL